MSQEFLFVCGFPSSGTDLLRNVLNAHPQINIGGEFLLLPTLATNFNAVIVADELDEAQEAIRRIDIYGLLKNAHVELPTAEPMELSDMFARMLLPERVKWAGSKTPQNTENMNQLLHLFPKAKFIIVVRDIRDVALSWRKKWGKSMFMCAEKWNSRMMNSVDTTSGLSNHQYMYILYEDLLTHLEREATRICGFLDIAFDPRILNFQTYVREKVPGKINFGEAIVQGNSGKWVDSLRPEELARIEEIAWPAMKKFGYEPEAVSAPASITKFEILRGTLRDIFAVIAVGNRTLENGRFSSRLMAIRVLALKLIAKARGRMK